MQHATLQHSLTKKLPPLHHKGAAANKDFQCRLAVHSEVQRAVAHTRGGADGGDSSGNGGNKGLPQHFFPRWFSFTHSSMILSSLFTLHFSLLH
jgi:hypothetical protein